MKTRIIVSLLLVPSLVLAGGDSREVSLKSLFQTAENTYVLKYVEGGGVDVSTLHLSYDAERYSKYARFLTQERFDQAISLLNRQLASKQVVYLGSFGGGPCLVDKAKQVYRSDALDIYEGGRVVYVFCRYR